MRLLLVSHSPSPNVQSLTAAVIEGASDPGLGELEVQVREALKAGPDDVLQADGLILGTTENFGYMSGALKDFFDRIYYPCLEHTVAMPYSLYVRAGNDGLGAKTSIERIVAGLSWKQVQEPLICRGEWNEDFPLQCREFGMTMAAGLAAGIF